MTKEEIIEQFQNAIDLIKQNGKDWLDERDIPMLKVAIRSLKNEQTDEDLISREVVIEWLNGKDIIKLSSQEETARRELKVLSLGKPQTCGDLISRQAVIDIVEFECGKWKGLAKTIVKEIEQLPSAEKTEECKDMGEVSDGYHTFNQLYHQRAILFATIVNQNKDISWKSFKHEDGKYCFDKNGEWFIVGIDTPEGSYTYHYEKKYWDYFKCKELETAKHWDGHTEEDVIRLLSLGDKNDL